MYSQDAGERENGSYQTRGRRACIAADTGRLVDRKTGGWYLNARSPSNGARIALSQSDMLITSCQLSVIGPAHNVDLLENGGTWRRIAFCHDPSIVSPSPIFVRSNSIVIGRRVEVGIFGLYGGGGLRRWSEFWACFNLENFVVKFCYVSEVFFENIEFLKFMLFLSIEGYLRIYWIEKC